MENKNNKTKKGTDKKKISIVLVVLAVIVLTAICVVIFKPFGNKEKVADNKKTEVSQEVEDNSTEKEVKKEKVEAKPVDKTVLENLVNNAESIDTTNYTQDSVAAFNTALEEARSVLQTGGEQTQIEGACKKLVDAIQSLTK